MRAAVIVFPGTNCEFDTKYALNKLSFEVDMVWHKKESLRDDLDLVVLPGGFSYGDYLRSGAISKFAPIMKAVMEYAKKGGYVLGICNGFQILLESHMLPGAMMKNRNVHFISKYHGLKVINNNNKFLSKTKVGDILKVPIAHGEGNYYIDSDSLKSLYDNEQVILKYCDENGEDLNPNGSVDSIAGICNRKKNIFGLMPHPERAVESILGSVDGIKMLEGFLS